MAARTPLRCVLRRTGRAGPATVALAACLGVAGAPLGPGRPAPAAGTAAPRIGAPVAPRGVGEGMAPVRFSLRPAGSGGREVLVYEVRPGEEVTDGVVLANLGTAPTRFRVYATDAFTSRDGAFTLLPGDRRPRALGAWVRMGTAGVTVPPGGRVELPFRIRVPAEATPGDHVGGVVASVRADARTATGRLLALDRRIAVRVYLRVRGPVRPALVVSALRWSHDPAGVLGGTARVRYRVTNVGNVRLGAAVRVQANGLFGVGLARAPEVEHTEILPGSSVVATARLPATERVGPVTVRVAAAAVPTTPVGALPGPATAATTRVLVPTALLIGFGVAAAVVLARAVPAAHRRRRAAGGAVGVAA